ncbi:hypothetical protein QBC38DRAFT_515385 [Podospora fimiseda]|uniref:Uncharacterized protein n=1 Tax=Podospora fimiseda TaxID=252190 RepID=A0AAN7BJ48_9PEZI|nr:hypothetical protein QBC38DRAFT_515385 [Podospora fimiseda]
MYGEAAASNVPKIFFYAGILFAGEPALVPATSWPGPRTIRRYTHTHTRSGELTGNVQPFPATPTTAPTAAKAIHTATNPVSLGPAAPPVDEEVLLGASPPLLSFFPPLPVSPGPLVLIVLVGTRHLSSLDLFILVAYLQGERPAEKEVRKRLGLPVEPVVSNERSSNPRPGHIGTPGQSLAKGFGGVP